MQHMPTHLKFTPTKSFDAAKLFVQQLSHLKVRSTLHKNEQNREWEMERKQGTE